MKYQCICGYIYDDNVHDDKFIDLPDTWICPICGANKSDFNKID